MPKYDQLKGDIASTHDPYSYQDAKTDFILWVLERARAERDGA